MRPLTHLSVRISTLQRVTLQAIARERHVPISTLLREAIDHVIDRGARLADDRPVTDTELLQTWFGRGT